MRSIALLLLVLSIGTPDAALGDERQLTCNRKRRHAGGGGDEIELKLDVDGDRVRLAWLSACTWNGRPGGGSCCTLELTGQREDVTWLQAQEGAVTSVLGRVTDAPEHPERLEIEQKGQDIEVRLQEVSLRWCGFGSEFPQAVTLQRGKPTCLVRAK